LRIAVFTNQFPSRISTFFARDMRPLVEAGMDLHIFAIYPLDPALWRYVPAILDERILPRDRTHHLRLRDLLRHAGPWPPARLAGLLRDTMAVAFSAARFGLTPLAKSLYVSWEAWAWAKQYGDQFDHVVAYWGNYAATCAYLFHRVTGTSAPFSVFLQAGTDLYRDQVYLRQKLLYADNLFPTVAFNQRYLAEHYGDIYPQIEDRIHVYYTGLDLAEFPYQPEGRPQGRVMAVGTLGKFKGFDYLVRSVAELTHRGRADFQVELIGDGPERENLEQLARELNVAERVRFRGYLPFEEVRQAMTRATILVHPSSGLGDGLPNVVREAMALGTPVIASDVAGIPEGLDGGACGILVPPRDVPALGDAIQILLADAALRRRYADAARRRVEARFDLWKNGRELVELLNANL
jgi:glycosyltransferase involved in cell wall biosynthesis